jgi:hypothetical protein
LVEFRAVAGHFRTSAHNLCPATFAIAIADHSEESADHDCAVGIVERRVGDRWWFVSIDRFGSRLLEHGHAPS